MYNCFRKCLKSSMWEYLALIQCTVHQVFKHGHVCPFIYEDKSSPFTLFVGWRHLFLINACHMPSASFLADISGRSPRKALIFIIFKKKSGSKYPKVILFSFKNRSTGRVYMLAPCAFFGQWQRWFTRHTFFFLFFFLSLTFFLFSKEWLSSCSWRCQCPSRNDVNDTSTYKGVISFPYSSTCYD